MMKIQCRLNIVIIIFVETQNIENRSPTVETQNTENRSPTMEAGLPRHTVGAPQILCDLTDCLVLRVMSPGGKITK